MRQLKYGNNALNLRDEKYLVDIRNIEIALGSSVKSPSKSERPNMEIARKSIVAKCTIKIGELLTKENLTIKRPGNGISPMRWDEILGTAAQKYYVADELI